MNGLAADVLAAAGDTWGIPGPLFLAGYVLIALLLVVRALRKRRAGSTSAPARDLSAFELAYLAGGRPRALAAALASLRAQGAVEPAGRGRLRATGAPGRFADGALDGAALAVVRSSGEIAVTRLQNARQVRRLLDDMQSRLERRGLLNGALRRARLRLPALWLLALAAVGAVRVIAGVRNERPVLWLVLAIVATVAAAVAVASTVPRLAPAGRRALEEARREHAHLDPANRPAWSTYGASGLAVAVAVYGLTAMEGYDPRFVAEAGLHRILQSGQSGGHAGGGDGGGCGGGCGGGDGGGGCGGGGCGGGCGG
ncbi:TIGR04222 domain-containing membrane protein [Thermomonospora catenispora]|uniref:TIGR04222 domain-containing membrane protein n=1 Tax=Thermomonospora catenispora TaxID=2493090 RepID=UPI00137601E3|nr:TIGR04222 domain-containing membrane protein [Thermomonospora catenispora]